MGRLNVRMMNSAKLLSGRPAVVVPAEPATRDTLHGNGCARKRVGGETGTVTGRPKAGTRWTALAMRAGSMPGAEGRVQDGASQAQLFPCLVGCT